MPISVDWKNKIINVPKDVLTLVQSTPTEILSLDLNWFRLQLKDIEDGVEGVVFLDTHRHNPPVDVGGVTLSRVVEIINGYTVTFEDGFYAVNLIGANSNVGDRVNVNSVSVRTANSAGLVTSAAIEQGEYNGGITIDSLNGYEGSVYPIGTPRKPCKYLDDAIVAAQSRGFDTFYIKGNFTLEYGDVVSNYILIGDGASFNNSKTTITMTSGCVTSNTHFKYACMIGRQGGEAAFSNCVIGNISNTHCQFDGCSMLGPVTLSKSSWTSTHTTDLIDCHTSYDWYIVDYNASPLNQVYSNFSGKIKFINITNSLADIIIQLDSGSVWLDASCTAGNVTIRGLGELVNDSTGLTIDLEGLINKSAIASSVNLEIGSEIQYASYGSAIHLDIMSTYSGTEYPMGTHNYKVNNLTDALIIGSAIGIDSIMVYGSLTINSGESIEGYTIKGTDRDSTFITLISGALTTAANLYNLSLTGHCGGRINIYSCYLHNVENLCASGGNANIYNTYLSGIIQFRSVANMSFNFSDCVGRSSLIETTILDINSCSATTNFSDFTGSLILKNSSNPLSLVNLDTDSGNITLDSTITEGTYNIRGVGILVDNSEGNAIVNSEGLMSKNTISQAVLNTNLEGFTSEKTVAASLKLSSYSDTVTIDTTLGVSGTLWPTGSEDTPVNNIYDALSIATSLGFKTLNVRGNLTIPSGVSVSNYLISGQGASYNNSKTTITMVSGCNTSNTEFYHARMEGYQGGESIFNNCVIGNISNSHCQFNTCGLVGPVKMVSSSWTNNHLTIYKDCYTFNGWYTIDYNNSPINQVYSNLSGKIKITNCSNSNAEIIIQMDSGEVWLDSSCSAGSITIRGICLVKNDSIGTTLVDLSGAINGDVSIYNKVVYYDVSSTYSGINYPTGTFLCPVNNIEDMVSIIRNKSINTIHIHSDITLTPGLDLTNMVFEGHNTFKHTVYINSGVTNDNTIFRNLKIRGQLNTVSTFDSCYLEDIINLQGNFTNCMFDEDITAASGISADIHLINCRSHYSTHVNFAVYDAKVNCTGWVGMLRIKNKVSSSEVNIGATWGSVIIDNTCTDGFINIVGTGVLEDNSNGSVVDSSGLNNKYLQASAILGAQIGDYTTSGTIGKAIGDIYSKMPVGDIASYGEYSNDILTIKNNLERTLGLVQENYYIDNTHYINYNGAKLMTSGRMRIYSDAASVGTSNNVLATYNIATSWTNDMMNSYKVTRV